MTRKDTEDLLDWISECCRRAAESALRRYAQGAVVGFLVLLVANVFVWQQGNVRNGEARKAIVRSSSAVSVEGCNRDFETITSIRQVLVDAKNFQLALYRRGEISESRYEASAAYYDDQVAKLVPPDCRKAARVLTENPDKAPNVPRPLHP